MLHDQPERTEDLKGAEYLRQLPHHDIYDVGDHPDDPPYAWRYKSGCHVWIVKSPEELNPEELLQDHAGKGNPDSMMNYPDLTQWNLDPSSWTNHRFSSSTNNTLHSSNPRKPT